jgi:hypothetical protein
MFYHGNQRLTLILRDFHARLKTTWPSVLIDKVAAETEQHKSGPLCGLSRR